MRQVLVTCFAALLLLAPTVQVAGDQDSALQSVVRAAHTSDVDHVLRVIDDSGLDPWIALDHLSGEGLTAAARAAAARLRESDARALQAYVATDPRIDATDREALAKARSHMRARAWNDAIHALEGTPTAGPSVTTVRWYQIRGEALIAGERTSEGVAALKTAADEAEAIGWLGRELRIRNRLFEFIGQGDDHREMRRVLTRKVEILRTLGRTQEAEENELDLAVITLMEGDPAGALPLLEAGERRLRDAGDEGTAQVVRIRKAIALGAVGDLATALSELEAAGRWMSANGVTDEADYADQTRASFLIDLGLPDRAADILGRLLDSGGGMSDRDRSTMHSNLALAYCRMDKAKDAEKEFASSLTVARSLDAPLLVSQILHVRAADLYLPNDRLEEARRDAQSARALLMNVAERNDTEPDSILGWGYASLATADIELRAGDPTEAMQWYEEALETARGSGDLDLAALAHGGLAATYLADGDAQTAKSHAIEGQAILRRNAVELGDAEGIGYRGSTSHARLFETRSRAAWLAGNDDDLFDALEAERATLLVRRLGGREALRGVGLPEDLAREEAQAQSAVRRALLAYSALRQAGELKRARLADARRALEAERRAHDDVATRIQRGNFQQGGIGYTDPISRSKLAESLPPDHAVALFMRADRERGALVVTHDRTWRVEIAATEVNSLLADIAPAHDRGADRSSIEAARAGLYTHLVASLRLPKSVRTLFVSPDGALATIPWPWLLPAASDLRVVLVPSATTLAILIREQVEPGKSKLLVGDPVYAYDEKGVVRIYAEGRPLSRLTHTADEVKLIFEEGDTRLVGQRATEAAVKEALRSRPRWAVAHFATHGLVHRDLASMSALAFSPTSEEDGFLTGTELLRMNVPADLVVLSACDVGTDRFSRGEGMLGLVRAFIASGAPRVVASLWSADDASTAALMARFYEGRRSGLSNVAALRAAQDSIRSFEDDSGKRIWQHPYYWAGWVVWGVPR